VPRAASASAPWRSTATLPDGSGAEHDEGVAQPRLQHVVGGLVHHGVPGREGRGELRTGQDQREVEGRDRGDHAERSPARVGEGAQWGVAGGAVQGLGERGTVLVLVGRGEHVDGAAQGDGLADVEALEGGEFVGVLAYQLGDAMQHPAPLTSPQSGPGAAVEGLPCGAYGGIHVGRSRLGDRRDHLAGGRIDHVRTRSVHRLAPLSADEQPPGPALEGGRHRPLLSLDACMP
jgi:hypothetical protein